MKSEATPASVNRSCYTNTLTFNCWVAKGLLPDLKPGQTVILDHASFHKSPRTTERIESVGCKFLDQPPYSPDLNKIDPLWANLKNNIRDYYDDTESFLENLDKQFVSLCSE